VRLVDQSLENQRRAVNTDLGDSPMQERIFEEDDLIPARIRSGAVKFGSNRLSATKNAGNSSIKPDS